MLGAKTVQVSFAEQVRFLFEATDLLTSAEHMPCRLYCHEGESPTQLETDTTHFGFVLSGENNVAALADGRRYPLFAHSYFSFVGECSVEGDGQIVIISRFGYKGLDHVGGIVEPWGATELH